MIVCSFNFAWKLEKQYFENIKKIGFVLIRSITCLSQWEKHNKMARIFKCHKGRCYGKIWNDPGLSKYRVVHGFQRQFWVYNFLIFSSFQPSNRAKSMKQNMKMTNFKIQLGNADTGYSFWDWLRNFLHKFPWIILSVHKLNKIWKFW